jgi:hypothetical protein
MLFEANPWTVLLCRQQRRQFGAVLRDCAQLLHSLGIQCVTAPGNCYLLFLPTWLSLGRMCATES